MIFCFCTQESNHVLITIFRYSALELTRRPPSFNSVISYLTWIICSCHIYSLAISTISFLILFESFIGPNIGMAMYSVMALTKSPSQQPLRGRISMVIDVLSSTLPKNRETQNILIGDGSDHFRTAFPTTQFESKSHLSKSVSTS